MIATSIQYRERSDRMPALNHRFKSSWDYRVPASGRFARGTALGGDSNRIIHAQSPSFYPPAGKLFGSVVELTRLRSDNVHRHPPTRLTSPGFRWA